MTRPIDIRHLEASYAEAENNLSSAEFRLKRCVPSEVDENLLRVKRLKARLTYITSQMDIQKRSCSKDFVTSTKIRSTFGNVPAPVSVPESVPAPVSVPESVPESVFSFKLSIKRKREDDYIEFSFKKPRLT